MGIDFNDSKGIKPKDKQLAMKGENMMKSASDTGNTIISPETANKQKSLDDVLVSSQKNMNVVKQVISQCGFAGADKDKYDISQAHSEWLKARNENINCPDQIIKTSVRYTTLVNGKAGHNEIVKAHQERISTKKSCDKTTDRVISTATEYLEVDRRVRENRLKEQNTYPIETMTTNIEKFQNRGSVIEGFNYYNVDNRVMNNPTDEKGKFNQRLPRKKQSDQTTSSTDQTIIPWNQYYTQCDGNTFCENAHKLKDQYISSINSLFDKAEEKLKLYQYAIQLKSMDANNGSTLDSLLDANNGEVVNIAIENQKKDIALHKQQALYNYDQYNSLSFIEDMFIFVYYAVFAMFVVFSLREFFSSYGSYDKRNIAIIILLGVYPKYILKLVLWLLNGLTEITQMLGVKNVSFWY